MKSYRLVLAAFALAATCVQAQKPEMTARELFYTPAGATVVQSSGSAAKPVGTPTAAKLTPRPAKTVAAAVPAAPPKNVPPPKEYQSDKEVRLVTAQYSGGRPLGLRYAIMKRNEDSSWDEASPDAVFQTGDKIRVKVESNEAGHLYIVAKGSSGNWDVLFPSKKINGGDNRVEAGEAQLLPGTNAQWTLDSKPGEERLFLVLSRKPVADLDKLIYDLNRGKQAPEEGSAPPPAKAKAAPAPKQEMPKGTMLAQNISPIDDALVGRLRTQVMARDLVFEKVDETRAAVEFREAAVYVVDKSGRPDARIIADIKFAHN
ncbi:MAG: DUF4384 domain-containing protein [Candidatus Solibacter usitatus]|nr:DUF4384 domain-containing protein [Candidatus Solibacter usitatus]